MTVAKRRAIDAFRRDKMRERKHEAIARALPIHDARATARPKRSTWPWTMILATSCWA